MAMLNERRVSSLLDDYGLIERLLAFQHPRDIENSRNGPLVHNLIETQAQRTPDAVAVQFEREAFISYRKLNETVNAVARHLVCGRGTIIPVAVSRSPRLVIALLAVLKTGAAYLPVSPETPADRVRFVLEDTRAPFLIVDSTTQDLVPGVDTVSIDELVSRSLTASAAARNNLNIYQTPSDTAYVIYTSGTTGRPKGVVLSHAAVVTGLSALPQPRPGESLRQLLCHAPHFSAAQRTVLGTLSRGGTLCLASKESVTIDLAKTLREMDVASLEITPSMLRLISPEQLPQTVKRVVLGGEAISSAIVDVWADKVELISAYGLSECTQLNMRHRILPGRRPNLLGKPTDSTICYVLAPGSLSPVPVNEPGELCLGGNQLADRYLRLPGKTREVFVPNPFGHGRLYRTGDMVAIRSDGSLELLGRIDQQIKIDGQRVEPSESDAAIQTLPGVVQSFVVSAIVLDRAALAAFIVSDDSKPWTTLVRDIRSALKDQIPSYAIPKYWLKTEEIPLNASGKVDVSKLVAVVQSKMPAEMTPNSAQQWALNALEQTLTEAMAMVLPVSATEVDVGMSFQELGGTSLDAILLAAKLRHAGIHVSVPDILQAPSLRELAGTHFTFSFEQEEEMPQPFSLLPKGVPMPSFEGLVDAYPATPLQEGILADTMLQNANYVYQRVYRIRGVHSMLVRSALETVVQLNPIFRTSFVPWKRGFLQLVRATVDLPFKQLQGVKLESVMRESASQEMPLDGPLVRATICNDEHLILEMHHALFDYWSRQFLVADAAELLLNLDRPHQRLPFSSYVAYQQKHLQKPETMAFWRNYLHAMPGAVLDVPSTKESGGPLVLTAKLGDGLTHLSHAAGVTVGTVVHAAWALTLAAELNSDDVAFVTEFSGRDADIDGVLDLAGPTLCTAPIRMVVDKAQTALQFTSSVQANLWSLSKHAHAGLRNALAAASVKPALVNTMVNVLVELEDVSKDGPLIPVVTHADNFTQYISIEVTETDPTVARLLVPYAADESRASRTLAAFTRCVKWLSTHPQQPLRDLFRSDSPVPASPTTSSTSSFLAVHPAFGLAHAPFESCAASTPSKPAILTTDGATLTYAQLDGRANALAAHLLSQGVTHGELIPLYMEKSAATLIAVLAILKAGAAFAPLDPRNPADRNRFIASDVSAKRIVTDTAHKEACATVFADLALVVPEEMGLDERAPPVVPPRELSPDSSAYTIYTSGSTGVPKGVLVPHSAVAASTLGMVEATAVTSEWRALWVLNYVFDASYYDVFTLLSVGATICLGPQDDLLGDLAGIINRLGVEQVMLTPTITKLIRGGPRDVPGLKVLNVCGEKIDVNILEWAKSVDVYNGYGPTEATILMTVSKVEPDGDLNSIGRGLKYVEAVIVEPDNNSLKRVGPGQVGELCVRGPQLAKGYINRPEQTSAVFMSDVDGERLYRTGDLARWADDGSLICLGRKDYQIKLNGFRIELGEIENAILLTGLVEATVVSVAEIGGKRQLVAFCIFSGDGKATEPVPTLPELRLDSVAELKGKLTTISHYMMPSLFLPFHAFPTLASGKANRKELVALVESLDESVLDQYRSQEEEEEFKAVETEEERIMQEAWSAVLDRPAESIGSHSVFATLGGDSVSAINVVAECRRLSYTISVAHVLAEPTLGGQAKKLKRAERKTTAQPVKITIPQSVTTAIANAGIDVEDVYPCGPGQTEFLIQGNTEHQFWNLTACRELPQDFDLAQWKKLTEALTAYNPILRACYIQADRNIPSSWYQVTLKDSTLNWEELTYQTDEEKVQLMEQLRDSTFTFGKAHVKYRLLHNARRDSRTLCIKVDHGSYDGTLLRIFDSHLAALSRGEKPAVHNFKTYIDWVSTCTDERQADLSYWQRTLSTYAPPAGSLTPTLSLAHPVADRLKLAPLTTGSAADAIAAQYGVTPATLFLAAYLVAARRLTDSADVLLDNLTTGRNAPVARPDALAGTCATFLPLRWTFAPHADARTRIAHFLADVQAAFWETTEHGAVGLQDIYDVLGRDRHGPAAAKLLFCFQPFDPPAPGAKQTPRWLVMAQSKAYMTINYALMVEVQKTAQGGFRLKLQWDSRAMSEQEVDGLVEVFERILGVMGGKAEGVLEDLL